MSPHEALAALAEAHRLDAKGRQQLRTLAGFGAEPPALAGRAPQVMALAAAALAGFGLVMWVAAQWPGLDRVERFWLLQGIVGATALATLARGRWRRAPALLLWIASGALLAFFGQTYQTGADPWQLFAIWAAIGLPIAFALRDDLLWLPWSLVAMTAVATWASTLTGHRWRVEPADLPVQVAATAIGLAVMGLLSPWLARVTGAGRWSHRAAFLALAAWLVTGSLAALFRDHPAPQYGVGLAALVVVAALHARGRGFDLVVLSLAALGIDTLLIAGLARALFWMRGDPTLALLLIGLAAAGLLAASVSAVLRLQRRARADDELASVWAETRPTVPAELIETDDGERAADAADRPRVRSADELLDRARAAGVLPAEARLPPHDGRPWPVQVLLALGAWLSALPLLALIGSVFGGFVADGIGTHLAGLGLTAGAVTLLRRARQDGAAFVEHLAVPLLLAGIAALGIALSRDVGVQAGLAVLLLAGFVIHALVPQRWLQTLIGVAGYATAAALLLALQRPWLEGLLAADVGWSTLHLLGVAAVLLTRAAAVGVSLPGRLSGAGLDAYASGWTVATLVSAALWSGQAFLVGGVLGTFDGLLRAGIPGGELDVGHGLRAAVSAALVAYAAWRLTRRWSTLRQPAAVGAWVVVAALAAAMPALGLVAALGVWALLAGRRGLAVAAALTATWVVSSFYYRLEWPLALKGVGLIIAGLVLAVTALSWRGVRHAPTPARTTLSRLDIPDTVAEAEDPRDRARGWRWLAPVAVAAVALVMVELGVRERESLIANGRAVFVPLAPVDPRSLMQGDYMRLAFELPPLDAVVPAEGFGARRPQVIGPVDEQGVFQPQRVLDGGPIEAGGAAGELRMELAPSEGRWTLVTDAWFFPEGDGARWQSARFGEFRVLPDGRALLVGLADAERRRIPPLSPLP